MCGENEPKMKFFKISRPDYGGSWISRNWGLIQEAEFDGMEVGDKIQIEIVEMTESQSEALSEFEGW